jgi:plasmid stabilization system protein ParE
MAYLVKVSHRAERDLEDIYAAVNAEHSDMAFQWFNRLERALLTLEESPQRCPVTREDTQLRHLLYGKKPHVYRVIFRVHERPKEVDILHIRRGARKAFKSDDLT